VSGAAHVPPDASPLIVSEPAPDPVANPEGNDTGGALTAATETVCAAWSGSPWTPSASGPGQTNRVWVTGSAWVLAVAAGLLAWARLTGTGR